LRENNPASEVYMRNHIIYFLGMLLLILGSFEEKKSGWKVIAIIAGIILSIIAYIL